MQSMGTSFFSKDEQTRYNEQLPIVTNLEEYFTKYRSRLDGGYLNNFTFIGKNDPHRQKFANIFEKLQKDHFDPSKLQLSNKESRGIAVMLGMAICDALGASTEFHTFKKQGHGLIKEGFDDIYEGIKNNKLSSRHGYTGVWTDDASMGLAMAYSLMLNDYKLNPVNIRYMFHLWLEHGLGNGGRPHSIGLGGNISISMREFSENPTLPFTAKKNQDNNGNGSLMRLAPIPVTFCDDLQTATKGAQDQSLTTHNGLEAKQCSRLMTEIIVALINRKESETWKDVLIQTCDAFKSQEAKSVQCLAKGQMQTQAMIQDSMQKYPSFDRWNKGLKDRNWNWRESQFTYSPTRTAQYSGYAGSYCMDGLAMALHCVYHTNSFKQCALKCAKMGGDSDTVGAIAGQITGAIYGITTEILELYSEMPDFRQKRYEAFLVAKKLVNKGKLLQVEGCWNWILLSFQSIRRYFYWLNDQ